jgi:hypothetical protein
MCESAKSGAAVDQHQCQREEHAVGERL